MKKEILDIGEVVKLSGLPASTLRYYEEKGLISSVGRNGLRRTFDANVVQRLSLISLGRLAGLSLEEIETMFTGNGKPQINRFKLLKKADELEQTITQLGAMRDGLRHAANCSAPSHFECPKFIKLLNGASKRLRRRDKA